MENKMAEIRNRAKNGKAAVAEAESGKPQNPKEAPKPLTDEAWTANMDTVAPHFFNLQMEIDNIKNQLAQVEDREQDDDSDSDDSSSSDSD